jgi:hypothetical protein
MKIETSTIMMSPDQIVTAQGHFTEALQQFDVTSTGVHADHDRHTSDGVARSPWGPPTDMQPTTAEALIVPETPGLALLDQDSVPRPNFDLFKTFALDAGCALNGNGELEVRPRHSRVLVPGLRGFATFLMKTGNGDVTLTKPAIVLPQKTPGEVPQVAVLLAEKDPDGRAGVRNILEDQHALLDAEVVKQHSKLTAEHGEGDVPTVREIGTSLMVASSADPSSIHGESHVVAEGNFGQNFGWQGRQDFVVGGNVRSIRPKILPANRIIFTTANHHQLPPEQQLLGVALTPEELAIGMTLAATETKVNAGAMPKIDLIQNMSGVLNV